MSFGLNQPWTMRRIVFMLQIDAESRAHLGITVEPGYMETGPGKKHGRHGPEVSKLPKDSRVKNVQEKTGA